MHYKVQILCAITYVLSLPVSNNTMVSLQENVAFFISFLRRVIVCWLFKVCKQCHLLSVCSQRLKIKTWQRKLIQNLDGKEGIWRLYNLKTKCTTSLNTCKRLIDERPHWAGACERRGGMINFLSSHSNNTMDQEKTKQKQVASDYNDSGSTWSKVK